MANILPCQGRDRGSNPRHRIYKYNSSITFFIISAATSGYHKFMKWLPSTSMTDLSFISYNFLLGPCASSPLKTFWKVMHGAGEYSNVLFVDRKSTRLNS